MILHDDDPQKQERARGEAIQKLLVEAPVIYTPLPVDVCFHGTDNGGAPAFCGVEVKKPQDMADSAVRSGRLVQQFRNAQDWGCTHLYVMFQGIIREGRGGLLEEYGYDFKLKTHGWHTVENPQITYVQLDNFLNTLDIAGGISVRRSSDIAETARKIVDLYHWWQKPPEEHQSLDRFHAPVFLGGQVPLFRRMVKEVEGVGWTRSRDMMSTFAGTGLTIPDVLNLNWKAFTDVKGVGPKTAKAIEEAMHEPITTVKRKTGDGS